MSRIVAVFRSDNRSSYNALMVHLQGNVSRRFNLVANYTLSSAKTWGCVLGELFDYVDGVCNPLHAFGPGDYGPSGEDVTHRFVLAGTFYAPFGFEVSTLTQAESARPFTMTTPVDVNGTGDPDRRSRGGEWRADFARSISRNALYPGGSAREPAVSFRGEIQRDAVRRILQFVQPQ